MKKPPSKGPTHGVRIVQRGDELAQDSRSGTDRRGEGRGLNAGRRIDDHRRVRDAFLERVREMLAIGVSPSTAARILNDEGETTAQGEEWTESAIQQLLSVAGKRAHRTAWSPLSNDADREEAALSPEDADGDG